MKKRTLSKLLCFLLIFALFLGLAACAEDRPQNTDSSGEDLSQYEPADITEVDDVDWVEVRRSNAKIDYVGDEEVWGDPNLSFFRGTVQSFKTLRVDAGPRQVWDQIRSDIRYYVVLTVRVDDVFRGTMSSGETVTAFLPVVGDLGYFDYVKDTYESLTSGWEGIFAVVEAKGYSLMNDGKILTFLSLAEYCVAFYMMDDNPVSFQFLGREIFFPSLDEGEYYLRGKLEEYPCQ